MRNSGARSKLGDDLGDILDGYLHLAGARSINERLGDGDGLAPLYMTAGCLAHFGQGTSRLW